MDSYMTPDDVLAGIPVPQHVSTVGGKAAALAALHRYDLTIPPWVVLPVTALRASMSNDQQQVLAQAWADGCIDTVRQSLASVTPAPFMLAALADWMAANGYATVAVRSSAVGEDSRQHSYAGQYHSVLHVVREELAAAIAAVWQSAFAAHVLHYCEPDRRPSVWEHIPAVIIQQMVAADVAGVAFSSDPVSGRWQQAIVAASHGTGDALLSGTTAGDSYAVTLDGEVTVQQQADTSLVLAVAQVVQIASLARQIAALRGTPQDIEWALAGGQLCLLQARPITTMSADPDGSLRLWDNSNLIESYSGRTTPLTFSFARRAYAEVYRVFCRIIGVPPAVINEHRAMFEQMIGLHNGQMYYNLFNWYRLVSLLPGYNVNRSFLENMMGVSEALPAELAATLPISTLQGKLHEGLKLVGGVGGLLDAYRRLPHLQKQFNARLARVLGTTPPDLGRMRTDELVSYYRRLEGELLANWDAPIVNDFAAMIWYGVLRKLTTAWCDDTNGTLYSALLSGSSESISGEPVRRIYALAAIAARAPSFAATLCNAPLPVIERDMQAMPTFAAGYRAYLRQFGDRCIAELKLESPTLNDNPLPLLRSIGLLACQPDRPATPPTSEPQFHAAQATVRQKLRHQPHRRALVAWVLARTRAALHNRETMRFERTRVFGRARAVFRELGQRFVLLRLLDNADDIFYLEVEEILGYCEGTATSTNLRELVAVRRAAFAHYASLPALPNRFETSGIAPLGRTARPRPVVARADTALLQGTPASPGTVRGRVQRVWSPAETALIPGAVLVAAHTDPGWVLLFPAAGGLIVERGNPLSHAAIVAREMGLPAVVGIAGVTTLLEDGELVELDGQQGTVRRVAAAPPALGVAH